MAALPSLRGIGGSQQRSKTSFMRVYANADVRAVVHNVRVMRSPFLNIELFEA